MLLGLINHKCKSTIIKITTITIRIIINIFTLLVSVMLSTLKYHRMQCPQSDRYKNLFRISSWFRLFYKCLIFIMFLVFSICHKSQTAALLLTIPTVAPITLTTHITVKAIQIINNGNNNNNSKHHNRLNVRKKRKIVNEIDLNKIMIRRFADRLDNIKNNTVRHTLSNLPIIDSQLTADVATNENDDDRYADYADINAGDTYYDTFWRLVTTFNNSTTYPPSFNTMPRFDFGMPRNITARTGHKEATIKCRVDRLYDRSVSWIRKRDLHILTVGIATYTSDKRFQVTKTEDSRDWILRIKSPRLRDSGIYECQVNTEPKMSMAFQLNVIDISPDVKTSITGTADLYFKAGSAIILTCLVQQPSIKDVGPIYWYRGEYRITPFDLNSNGHNENDEYIDSLNEHNNNNSNNVDIGAFVSSSLMRSNNLLNMSTSSSSSSYEYSKYYHNRLRHYASHEATNHLNMNTLNNFTAREQLATQLTQRISEEFQQRIAMESYLGDTMKSRLRITNAQTSDSGNYTCQPATANSASVMVHVINDENPAAMQKSATNGLKQWINIIDVLNTFYMMEIVFLILSSLLDNAKHSTMIFKLIQRLYNGIKIRLLHIREQYKRQQQTMYQLLQKSQRQSQSQPQQQQQPQQEHQQR